MKIITDGWSKHIITYLVEYSNPDTKDQRFKLVVKYRSMDAFIFWFHRGTLTEIVKLFALYPMKKEHIFYSLKEV